MRPGQKVQLETRARPGWPHGSLAINQLPSRTICHIGNKYTRHLTTSQATGIKTGENALLGFNTNHANKRSRVLYVGDRTRRDTYHMVPFTYGHYLSLYARLYLSPAGSGTVQDITVGL